MKTFSREACPVFTPEQANPSQNWIPVGVDSNPLRHFDVIAVDASQSKPKRKAEMLRLVEEMYGAEPAAEEPEQEGLLAQ